MRTRDSLDRGALVLGVVSIVSAVFVFVHGTFQLVQIGAAGLVVALVLGLLAVVAGWLDERALMLARHGFAGIGTDDGVAVGAEFCVGQGSTC